MANEEHLEILKRGVKVWNEWRNERADISPDLSYACLSKADLRRADLSEVNLNDADLSGADLSGASFSRAKLIQVSLYKATLWGTDFDYANLNQADLSHAELSYAYLNGAHLIGANLSYSNLSKSNLSQADLSHANLREANLKEANLSRAILVEADLTRTILTSCKVYGISVWKIKLQETIQENLIITPYGEPTITVDNLKIAQFIYLLLNNAEIREVIDTIAKKAVLILGRFTPERKAILDALRNALRSLGYLPILFDFDKPASRDITETVSTLAHLSRFVIADITDAKSIPQELRDFIPSDGRLRKTENGERVVEIRRSEPEGTEVFGSDESNSGRV